MNTTVAHDKRFLSVENVVTRENDWKTALSYASHYDYHRLINAMYQEVEGTELQRPIQTIARGWSNEISLKRSRALKAQRVAERVGRLQLLTRFIYKLTPDVRAFVGKLFEMPTTLYIMVEEVNNGEICAVIDDPTALIIKKYSKMYTETLMNMTDHFRFMVHGEPEIYNQYDIKITKDEWHAFN